MNNDRRLKIAFFTPVICGTKSYCFSSSVLPFLKEQADVDIFSDNKNISTFCSLNVYHYLTAFILDKEKKYDIFFYQIENHNDTNFCRIHLALKPGVVFFHDFYLSSDIPQTILPSITKNQCNSIKRELGISLFSIAPSDFIVKKGEQFTRNNINTLYNNNILFLPYPLEHGLSVSKIKNDITKIVFEGSTDVSSRYFKVIASLKNVKNYHFVWLTEKINLEFAQKLCIDNKLEKFEVLENNAENIKKTLKNADIAISLLKSMQYYNMFFIFESLINDVFVIANKASYLIPSIDDLNIFPSNYISRVNIGMNESQEIEFFIKAYQAGKVDLNYQLLHEKYLVNFSAKNISFELLRLFNHTSDAIEKFYILFNDKKINAKKEVLNKAFNDDDSYLNDVRKELGFL